MFLTNIFNSNNQYVYSKSYVYSLISNNGYSYQLLTKVIETVDSIPIKKTIIQYKF